MKILETLSKILNIPFLLHGGFGRKEHIYQIAKRSNASGVLLSSLLHYNYLYCSKINIKNIKIGNTNFIMNKKIKKNNTIMTIKKFLKNKKINVRI